MDERDETVSKRIRDAELEKVPKVIVYGDRESTDSLSVRDRGGDQYQASLSNLIEGACYATALKAGADVPHLRGPCAYRFNRVGRRGSRAAAFSGFVVYKEEASSLVTRL